MPQYEKFRCALHEWLAKSPRYRYREGSTDRLPSLLLCETRLAPSGLFLLFVFDVVDGVFHRGNLFGIFVRYVDIEGFFKGHHQLHDIERIRAEIIDERGRTIHLALIYTQLRHDDLLHSLFNRHESSQAVCKLIDSSDDGRGRQLCPQRLEPSPEYSISVTCV